MPRVAGRTSTRKTIRAEDAWVARFSMHGDQNKGPCCIEGCDHRIEVDCGGAAGPAWIVREPQADKPELMIGWCCSHCADQVTRQDPPQF